MKLVILLVLRIHLGQHGWGARCDRGCGHRGLLGLLLRLGLVLVLVLGLLGLGLLMLGLWLVRVLLLVRVGLLVGLVLCNRTSRCLRLLRRTLERRRFKYRAL